jgi:V8-like Glu-specific endopeptidase
MPEFYTSEYVDIELDINVDEFFDKMTNNEKLEMFDLLIKDGFGIDEAPSHTNWEFTEAINKLNNNYYQLTNEEETLIIKLAKRF